MSRCREVEQDVATLKAQLVEKQTVQTENNRLKLQLESVEAQCKVEQRKAGEERSATTPQMLNTQVETCVVQNSGLSIRLYLIFVQFVLF